MYFSKFVFAMLFVTAMTGYLCSAPEGAQGVFPSVVSKTKSSIS